MQTSRGLAAFVPSSTQLSPAQAFWVAAAARANNPNSVEDPVAILRKLPLAQRFAVVQDVMFTHVGNVADPARRDEWVKFLTVAAGALNSANETPVVMMPIPAGYARDDSWQRVAIGVAGVALGVGVGILVGRRSTR